MSRESGMVQPCFWHTEPKAEEWKVRGEPGQPLLK